MGALDERAKPHQERLIQELRARGVDDVAVLDAFAAVPRHLFVDRFWVAGLASDAAPQRQGQIVDQSATDDVLELVYAPDLALLTGPHGVATSSVSAPHLIACMLEELDLVPGMRILEIGAGSGYHAALLATLVGDPTLVTSLEIDRAIVDRTRERLRRLGFGALSIVAVDGDVGVPGMTFDRIVATVGCADLAPAWQKQLSTDGAMLVPLAHGPAHPRVKLWNDADRLRGQYTGYSGFVGVQGIQAGRSPWPPRQRSSSPVHFVLPLPQELAAALAPPDRNRPLWAPSQWACAFYIALRDIRAAFPAGLMDHDSFATIEREKIVAGGPTGEILAATLESLAQDWFALGAPDLDRYTTTFTNTDTGTPALLDNRSRRGTWLIRRFRHHQSVQLAAG